MAKQYTNLTGKPVNFQTAVLKTAAALPTNSVLARRALRSQRRNLRAL